MSVQSDEFPRVLTVKPRRRGYTHRHLVAVTEDGLAVDETGEVHDDLPALAFNSDPLIWLTTDPAYLLLTMVSRFRDHPYFNYQVITSMETDMDVTMSHSKLTRFGFSRGREKRAPGRHRGLHLVWSPADMSRNPTDFLESPEASELLRWGRDVREWCREQNIPLPTSLSGISSSLLKDSRFWPDARGRVPRATNERLRSYLPGVYSELRTNPGRRFQAIALDQRTAYHRAAQEVPTPNPDNLFARGYFNLTDDPTAPMWAPRDSEVYRRTMAEPGLVFVQALSRQPLPAETKPPATNYNGRSRVFLWTNEVALAEEHGLEVEGIIAAWTSTTADPGLPRYGAWAEAQIQTADPARKLWLKPTLHGTYGLLAARARDIYIGHGRGRGRPAMVILGAGHEVPVRQHHLGAHAPTTTNVAMLGTLQAEVRVRSMRMANALMANGVDVLHIHADGLHVTGQVPLVDVAAWKTDPADNLEYIDPVSWFSDQGDTLPGRDARMRAELRRHRLNLLRETMHHAT